MTETEEMEAIKAMPNGYYRVMAGTVKDGDMTWWPGWFDTCGHWENAVINTSVMTDHYMVCCPMEGYKPYHERIMDAVDGFNTAKLDHDLRETKAKTDDEGKPAIAHLPYAALEGMAKVQAYGAKKYGDFYNYRKGMEACRNLSCALRHIYKWIGGENNDEESGESHLFHAMVRISFVVQNEKDGTMIDDRYSKEEV